MRSFFIFVLLFSVTSFTAFGAEVPATQPATSAIAIRVAVPENEASRLSEYFDLHIVIENISNVPQGIIDEWNSWGYFNLTLEFTLPNGAHKVMKKSENVNWRRNFLTWTKLQPGQVLVRDVVFDPKIWDGIPTVADGTPLLVKAILSQIKDQNDPWTVATPKGEKAAEGIWIGKAESSVVSVQNPGRS